ncbi:hypothetical protein B0H10DRAFT_1958317 [Mycena sp. CBHHK59/15]|nr:hypothetical protein B0H10DRAFT_1958317 [Mycena sp. CBHHK59/15]
MDVHISGQIDICTSIDHLLYTTNSASGDPLWGIISIGAGADGTVWGVNSAGNIFRYTGDQGDPNHWVQIPGGLTAIAAGIKTNVWGVNAGGNIFSYTGDDSNPWVQIAGGLADIGAGADGVVWGVNSDDTIFRWIRD